VNIAGRTILIADMVALTSAAPDSVDRTSAVPISVDRIEWARDMVPLLTAQDGRRLLIIFRLVPSTVVPA